jgi:hypothetical protein
VLGLLVHAATPSLLRAPPRRLLRKTIINLFPEKRRVVRPHGAPVFKRNSLASQTIAVPDPTRCSAMNGIARMPHIVVIKPEPAGARHPRVCEVLQLNRPVQRTGENTIAPFAKLEATIITRVQAILPNVTHSLGVVVWKIHPVANQRLRSLSPKSNPLI